jgi:multiple antibiotic resistance protein
MEDTLTQFIMNCVSLLAILNPFGNVPLCVTLTEDMSPRSRKKLFNLIVYTGFTIVILFGLLGDILMTYFFRVEMTEIRIAGGILLVIVALKNLLFSKKKPKAMKRDEEMTEEEEIQQGIIPMAFPIMVGPGSMTTILIIRREYGALQVVGAALVVFTIIKLLLKYSHFIEKVLGKLVLFVLGRVMQIFIMAIGVKTFISGIMELF